MHALLETSVLPRHIHRPAPFTTLVEFSLSSKGVDIICEYLEVIAEFLLELADLFGTETPEEFLISRLSTQRGFVSIQMQGWINQPLEEIDEEVIQCSNILLP